MNIRFFRRIRLAPWLRLNLSRSGPSLTVGPKSAHLTAGPKGTSLYAGLPGTGLSARQAVHYIPPDCDCLLCQKQKCPGVTPGAICVDSDCQYHQTGNRPAERWAPSHAAVFILACALLTWAIIGFVASF